MVKLELNNNIFLSSVQTDIGINPYTRTDRQRQIIT